MACRTRRSKMPSTPLPGTGHALWSWDIPSVSKPGQWKETDWRFLPDFPGNRNPTESHTWIQTIDVVSTSHPHVDVSHVKSLDTIPGPAEPKTMCDQTVPSLAIPRDLPQCSQPQMPKLWRPTLSVQWGKSESSCAPTRPASGQTDRSFHTSVRNTHTPTSQRGSISLGKPSADLTTRRAGVKSPQKSHSQGKKLSNRHLGSAAAEVPPKFQYFSD